MDLVVRVGESDIVIELPTPVHWDSVHERRELLAWTALWLLLVERVDVLLLGR